MIFFFLTISDHKILEFDEGFIFFPFPMTVYTLLYCNSEINYPLSVSSNIRGAQQQQKLMIYFV